MSKEVKGGFTGRKEAGRQASRRCLGKKLQTRRGSRCCCGWRASRVRTGTLGREGTRRDLVGESVLCEGTSVGNCETRGICSTLSVDLVPQSTACALSLCLLSR